MNKAYGAEEYEGLLEELSEIRHRKVLQYGPELQQIEDWDEVSLMAYANLGRKWRRMKNLLWTIPFKELRGLTSGEHRGLRDALLDMANYCLYAVQMLDKLLGAPVRKELDIVTFKGDPNRIRVNIDGEWQEFRGNGEGRTFFIEQVAIATQDPERLKRELGMALGLDRWSTDQVRASGEVWGEKGENVADLNFNYDLGPFEFELLAYKEGDSWLEGRSGLSHLGVHVEDMDQARTHFLSLGYRIAQEVRTQSHTNPYIKDSRRYWYVIFNTREAFGFDIKLIKRLEVE
jgi:transcriptional regulator of met regulon